MCNNNRKIGVCKQTGAFVSNRNKNKNRKKNKTERSKTKKEKNYTIRKWIKNTHSEEEGAKNGKNKESQYALNVHITVSLSPFSLFGNH